MSDGLKMCVKAHVTPGIRAQAQGAVSRGIRSAEIVDGDLILTLTDGSVLNLGRVEGDPGAPGAPGIPGQDGQDGAPGRDGADGAPGRDGADGAPGRDGADGAPGRDGADGTPGRDGQDGHSPVVEARRHPQQPVTMIIVDGVAQAYIMDGATGHKGDPGSDAEVTAANIASALGYTPVSPADYNPDSKTSAMTQKVGVDSDGKLWTNPGGGGGGDAVWGEITGDIRDQTDLVAAMASLSYNDYPLSHRVSTIEGKESGWDAKQDAISDLATIRAGAALGATALQQHQSLAAYRTAAAQDAIDATKLEDDDLCYHAGDTISLAGVFYAGILTGGCTNIRFYVPLQKKRNGRTFTLNALQMTVCGVGGNLISGRPSSEYTITSPQNPGEGLYFMIEKPDGTAFGGVNNSPVTVYITNSNSVINVT